MTRQLLDELLWLFRKHRGIGQERYYLRQLTRRPMTISELSIDPAGEWSPTKARRVLEIINPEARAHGVFFADVEITHHRPITQRRVILVAYCLHHEIAVARDSVCKECARGARGART